MNGRIVRFAPLDTAAVEVLLCDADGNLFGSEEPAFVASAAITNRVLAELGVARAFTPDELRRRAIGRNFRATTLELAREAGVTLEPDVLECWVEVERRAVVEELRSTLRPDPRVQGPVRRIANRARLALVSSSALSRLDACLQATALDDLFPPDVRFSAEDSLPAPRSKPDPAVYVHAGQRLGVAGAAAIAVEDAAAGALSALRAGFPTVGNLHFVAPDERAERADELREAGVAAVVPTWRHLAVLLARS